MKRAAGLRHQLQALGAIRSGDGRTDLSTRAYALLHGSIEQFDVHRWKRIETGKFHTNLPVEPFADQIPVGDLLPRANARSGCAVEILRFGKAAGFGC